MRIIKPVNVYDVQKHLRNKGSSVLLDNHHLEDIIQLEDYDCYLVQFEEEDSGRIFTLRELSLEKFTDGTFRMIDINNIGLTHGRVQGIINAGISLLNDGNEPVLIGRDTDAPLTIIDGNHRIIGHYLKTGNISGVKAFICVNEVLLPSNWIYMPGLAT